MRLKRLSTADGFTITEVLVSSAIVIIAMLGVSSVLTNSYRANNNLNLDINFTQIMGQTTNILSNRDTCTKSLSGQTPTVNSPINIIRPESVGAPGGPQPLIQMGQTTQGWIITRSHVSNIVDLTGSDKLITIDVQADKDTSVKMGASSKAKQFVVRTRLNGGVIEECWGSHDLSYICENMGGEYTEGGSPPCVLKKMALGTCPAGWYMEGFNADGTLNCKEIPICYAGDTRPCSVTNGTGAETCAGDGMSWGGCSIVSCSAGYALSGGSCVIASGSQTWATAGNHSFTIPDGVTTVRVAMWGAGGAGGANCTVTPAVGGGGGGGAYCYHGNYAVTPGQIINFTVGAAGTGYGCNAGITPTNGLPGGNSTLGSLFAGGGGGGSNTATGGPGGVASGCEINENGATGGPGYSWGGTTGGNAGGLTYGGGAGCPTGNNMSITGVAPGGGGCGFHYGGHGANGRVTISWGI